MSELKHTPGPWEAVKHSSDKFWYVKHKNSNNAIVIYDAGTESETGANAKLIAAAPEMLEALEMILFNHDNSEDFFKKATEAYNKATS